MGLALAGRVASETDRMPEMKAASLIDRVTSSPINYWASMITDVCGAAVFAYFGTRWYSGSLGGAVAAVIGGFITWTLIEYLLHRWLLHGALAIPRREHMEHHRDPRAMVSTPVPTIALLWLLLWALLSTVLPRGTAALLVFGVYAGYNHFAMVHHLQHHYGALLARSPLHAKSFRLHALHHRRPDMLFGITTLFWDRVLGTFLEDDEVVTKRATP